MNGFGVAAFYQNDERRLVDDAFVRQQVPIRSDESVSFKRCASRSIDRIATSAGTPLIIWLVTTSDPA